MKGKKYIIIIFKTKYSFVKLGSSMEYNYKYQMMLNFSCIFVLRDGFEYSRKLSFCWMHSQVTP